MTARTGEGQQPDVFGPRIRVREGPKRPGISQRITPSVHELQGVLDVGLKVANIESEEAAV